MIPIHPAPRATTDFSTFNYRWDIILVAGGAQKTRRDEILSNLGCVAFRPAPVDPFVAGKLFGEAARWMSAMQDGDLGTYSYMESAKELGAFDVPFDYIRDSGAAVVGDPDRCVEIAKRYEAAGCDLLLCLVNPYNVPHEKVMQTIELMGKHVLPEFS